MLALLATAGVLAWLPFRGRSTASAPPRFTRSVRINVSKSPPPPKPPTGPHDAPVPILMYHVLAPPQPNDPYPDLYVKPADFRAQVAWLAEHRYHAVTLRQVYDYWRGRRALPRKPVVLTFDDGYHSDFTVALPTLRARRWPGVLNLEVRILRPV